MAIAAIRLSRREAISRAETLSLALIGELDGQRPDADDLASLKSMFPFRLECGKVTGQFPCDPLLASPRGGRCGSTNAACSLAMASASGQLGPPASA